MGIKISGLPAAAGAAVGMQFEVNNGGTSQRLTLAQIFALSMGAVTADSPLLNLAQTWNNGGVTFTGLKLNVTDSASDGASKLLDLQLNGSTKFEFRKNGYLYIGNFSAGNTLAGIYPVAALHDSGLSGNRGLVLQNTAFVGWTSSDFTAASDLLLGRDAANTLALRNGTNAQALHIYNTYTDASNYERAFIGWSGNDLYIAARKAGTGSARQIIIGDGSGQGTSSIFFDAGSSGTIWFRWGGGDKWKIPSTGHLLASTDNTCDIGASGADRPRHLYLAGNVNAASLKVGGQQVVGARQGGWTGPTGTADRTAFDTATVTLAELAKRVKALIDDLTTHGLIGDPA